MVNNDLEKVKNNLPKELIDHEMQRISKKARQ